MNAELSSSASRAGRLDESSPLASAIDGGGFAWLTGIEDTFVTAPHPRTGRTLDEYALTGHYECWRADLELARELGVQGVRYGVPWHRVNPAPGVWDFSWVDGPLERLLEHAIEPVVDLVHYGVPAHIADAFSNPDYPARVAEYAARVAERYRGRLRFFTPLNEPRITAWYAGRLGFWPPYRRGYRGYVEVLRAVARGIVLTVRALARAAPAVRILHVDAADIYLTALPELEAEATLRQELGFLTLDLVTGRVDREHALYSFLVRHGLLESELAWFGEHRIELDIVGVNLYPLFSRKILTRSQGQLRASMPYANGELVETIATLYHQRYGRPIVISETASEGSVARRLAWLNDSVAAVKKARAQGVPIVGYTWWPLFALVAWAYRNGTKPADAYLKQMGLFNLAKNEQGELERLRTPLVEAFQRLVLAGEAAVGPLGALARPDAPAS